MRRPPSLTGHADAGPEAPVFNQGALTQRGEFSFPSMISVPAPCLGGGTLLITGTITGWFQQTQTRRGTCTSTSAPDFTALTAMLGPWTWTASPGAHEIFSFNSRSIAQGSWPEIRFVHRFRTLVLPSGDVQFNWVVTEVECIGSSS